MQVAVEVSRVTEVRGERFRAIGRLDGRSLRLTLWQLPSPLSSSSEWSSAHDRAKALVGRKRREIVLTVTSDIPELTEVADWERELLLPIARELLASVVKPPEKREGAGDVVKE